jgi:hypothetical protein
MKTQLLSVGIRPPSVMVSSHLGKRLRYVPLSEICHLTDIRPDKFNLRQAPASRVTFQRRYSMRAPSLTARNMLIDFINRV